MFGKTNLLSVFRNGSDTVLSISWYFTCFKVFQLIPVAPNDRDDSFVKFPSLEQDGEWTIMGTFKPNQQECLEARSTQEGDSNLGPYLQCGQVNAEPDTTDTVKQHGGVESSRLRKSAPRQDQYFRGNFEREALDRIESSIEMTLCKPCIVL
jgi:hypothetical protein